ncbi:MAG: YaaL family protein [Acetivibrio sp.]
MKVYQNNDYELLEEIERAKQEIEIAYLHFQNVLDPDLIDCYIFESNAAWKRYRFLLRQAKLLHTHS